MLAASVHAFDVLAEVLAGEGVGTALALGDANMNFATRRAGRGCRMVYVRREHRAVAAAMACAPKSGETGVAAIARGSGPMGEEIADLAAPPDCLAALARTGGGAVFDIPISDKVVSPVIRRVHPAKARE